MTEVASCVKLYRKKNHSPQSHRAGSTFAPERDSGRKVSACLDGAERIFAPRELNNTYSNFFRVFEGFEALEQRRRTPTSDYLGRFDR